MGFKEKVIVQTLGWHVSMFYSELERNKDHWGYFYTQRTWVGRFYSQGQLRYTTEDILLN